MRILYVCADLGIPVLGSKGASVHVRSLASALKRAGHDVILAAPVATKSPWDAEAALPVSFLHLPPGPDVRKAAHALKSLEETIGSRGSVSSDLRRLLASRELTSELLGRFAKAPPDAVYERASLFSTAGTVLARQLGVPCLVELNAPLVDEETTYRTTRSDGATPSGFPPAPSGSDGAAPSGFPPAPSGSDGAPLRGSPGLAALGTEVERWVLRQADVVLPVSNVLADYVIGLGVPPERVQVVPNGVDLLTFHPGATDAELRTRFRLGDGPVLGFVGGLRPWHGVEALPALLERLAPRHDGLRLLLVGDGPMRRALSDDLAARGLASRAVVTGALGQSEVAALLRQTTIALAPYPETRHAFYFSPLKLFEYMASGNAIVASGCGQIAEVLRHEENGLLVPAGNLDALEAACERLLGDEALRRRLGDTAAREAAARYSWDENARRVTAAAEGARRAS